MAATRQLKQQVTDLILGDGDIVKLIAEAVSSLIVEKISSNEETLDKIASSITKQPEFVDSVSKKFEEQKDAMKQEIYESLSFDNNNLQAKYKELEKTCNELKCQNKDLEWDIDSIEQYGRRNCLLFHGIPESTNDRVENTDGIVVDIMRNKLNINVDITDLDRSHRLGRRVNPRMSTQLASKPRPIIVKFLAYNIRAEVFRKKRQLKGSGLGVSESLTKKRMDLYRSVKGHPKIETTWSQDGRVIALRLGSQQKLIFVSPNDLTKLE